MFGVATCMYFNDRTCLFCLHNLPLLGVLQVQVVTTQWLLIVLSFISFVTCTMQKWSVATAFAAVILIQLCPTSTVM